MLLGKAKFTIYSISLSLSVMVWALYMICLYQSAFCLGKIEPRLSHILGKCYMSIDLTMRLSS